MEFKTVTIFPVSGNWHVNFVPTDGKDRVSKKTYPNAMGFFHYPVTMDDTVAFNKLKKLMIKKHKIEIDNLQKSLDMLSNL